MIVRIVRWHGYRKKARNNNECGARTEGFCPDTNKEDDTMENIEECKKRAIEAWNRRANDENTN
jgi:hypothetical protein